MIREKDTYLKLYRRLELTVNNIKMSTPSILKQGDDLRRLLRGIKNDEVFYRKDMVALRTVIDVNTLEFLKSERGEKGEMAAYSEQVNLNRTLEKELEEASAQVEESARTVESIKMERDLKVHHY